jgi:hypothetical protein
VTPPVLPACSKASRCCQKGAAPSASRSCAECYASAQAEIVRRAEGETGKGASDDVIPTRGPPPCSRRDFAVSGYSFEVAVATSGLIQLFEVVDVGCAGFGALSALRAPYS